MLTTKTTLHPSFPPTMVQAQSTPSWHNFRILFVFFSLSRVILLAARVKLLVGSDKHFDYRHFYEMAQLSDRGFYPHIHYWVEYPPLFPWLSTLVYRLCTLIATSTGIETWYYAITGLLRVSAEMCVLWMVYSIACEIWGDKLAWRSAMLYILFFVPYYLWNGAFDPLPAFALLLALYSLVRRHEALSAIAAGLGAAFKVFPILIVPLAVCTLPNVWQKVRYVAIALGLLALSVIPFLVVSPGIMIASLGNLLGRTSWETIWAILDGYFGPGSVAPLAGRFSPSTAFAVTASSIPWNIVTAVFFTIFAVFYLRFWGKRSGRRLIAGTGFTLHLLLVYSKGYSPQYLIWVAPIAAIVFPNVKGAIYLALLGVVNLLEYPGYFHFLPNSTWLLVTVVVCRTALLITIGFDYLKTALWNFKLEHLTTIATS